MSLVEPVFAPSVERPHHPGRQEAASALTGLPTGLADVRSAEVIHKIGALIDRVARFRSLPDDWDDEGSSAPDVSAITRAMQFLASFEDDWLPWVAPTTDGGVRVEWDGQDAFLMVNFEPAGLATVAVRLPGQESKIMHNEAIPDDLSWYYARVRGSRQSA